MRTVWKNTLLLAGVAALSITAHAPAYLLRPLLSAVHPELKLGTLSGYWWQGHAAQARYQQWDLGEVSWKMNWLALLQLQLAIELNVGQNSALHVAGQGEVRRTWFGWTLHEWRISLPANSINTAAPTIPMTLAGRIDLTLTTAKLTAKGCEQLQAMITWNQAGATLMGNEITAKPANAVLSCPQPHTLHAILKAQSPQFVVDAQTNLTSTGWDLNGTLQPKALTPMLKQTLSLLGSPDTKGSYPLQLKQAW
ncbi:MAG: type II secretion system protein N [Plesiomonas sp.]|uniref:type II secretion system protein N n=1 Tax=Plesiomonas sp. TaxID=2486279 RepID=UPI003F3C8718